MCLQLERKKILENKKTGEKLMTLDTEVAGV